MYEGPLIDARCYLPFLISHQARPPRPVVSRRSVSGLGIGRGAGPANAEPASSRTAPSAANSPSFFILILQFGSRQVSSVALAQPPGEPGETAREKQQRPRIGNLTGRGCSGIHDTRVRQDAEGHRHDNRRNSLCLIHGLPPRESEKLVRK